MKAIRFDQYGDYNQLYLADLPEPQPVEGEVLVKITAAAVNPLDNTVRLGYFSVAKKPPLVLGNEAAGVVVEPGSSQLAAGTRVMVAGTYGVLQDGTWREYVLAKPEELVPTPGAISDVEAAGVPIAYLTAQLALKAGGFAEGQTLLVSAVGSSVGNAAIQLARAQGAARVITTAGSTEKAEKARGMGYADVIDLSHEPLSDGVARLTAGSGVDLAIDGVGGPMPGQALASLKAGGTLVTLGYSAGTQASINLLDLISKLTRVVGFNLFAQTPQAIGEAYAVILRLLAEGALKPLVARTFPLAQAAEAQRFLIEGRPFGKVVLTL